MMSRVQKGIVSGLVATIAVSLLEIANLMLGPWANSFPKLLSYILQMPDVLAVGWAAHLIVGTLVLGPLFGILCPRLPTDTPESKGIMFAVAAWVVMMLTIAPLGGIGMFAAAAGFGTIAWMLVTHVVYGAVLGGVYGWMVQRDKRLAREAAADPHHAQTA